MEVFSKKHIILGDCVKLCESTDSDFENLHDRIDVYSDFAVDYRYPGIAELDTEDVQQSLVVLSEVWTFVTSRITENK